MGTFVNHKNKNLSLKCYERGMEARACTGTGSPPSAPPGQLCHPQPQPGSPSPSCPYPEVIEVGSSLTGKVSVAGSSHLLETRGSPPTVPILGGTDPFERAWGTLTVLSLPPHFMGPQFPGPMNMSPCLGKGTQVGPWSSPRSPPRRQSYGPRSEWLG